MICSIVCYAAAPQKRFLKFLAFILDPPAFDKALLIRDDEDCNVKHNNDRHHAGTKLSMTIPIPPARIRFCACPSM